DIVGRPERARDEDVVVEVVIVHMVQNGSDDGGIESVWHGSTVTIGGLEDGQGCRCPSITLDAVPPGGEMRARSLRRSLRGRTAAALSVLAVTALAVAACAPHTAIDIPGPTQLEAPIADPTLSELHDAVTHAMAA